MEGAQVLTEQKWRPKARLIHGPCGHPNTFLFRQKDVEFLSSDTHGFSRTLGLPRIESRDSGFLAVTLKHYNESSSPTSPLVLAYYHGLQSWTALVAEAASLQNDKNTG